MSYEVVARRWRPMTFESVVGQSHITKTLANAIARDRVPHAFLFTGIRGVGKTTIARLLARALNCVDRAKDGPGAEPCNKCPSCEAAFAGSSVDVVEIDGASNRGIDEVRSLIEASQYRPALGRFKVYIIDEVHQLSGPAFNALLKTLEEPPEHVKFIMATTESHKLPPTVLSRCQRYDFRRLTDTEITEHLRHIAESDGLELDDDALALLAREADGSMRDAQSLLEQVVAGNEGELSVDDVARLLGVAGKDLVSGFVEAILSGEAARVLELVREVIRYGYDAEKLLGELLDLLRHVAAAAAAGEKGLDPALGAEARAQALRLKELRTPLDLQRIFASILQTAADVRRAGYPNLVLEMGLLKVALLEPVATAAEVLARLQGLGSGGAGGGPGGQGRGGFGGGSTGGSTGGGGGAGSDRERTGARPPARGSGGVRAEAAVPSAASVGGGTSERGDVSEPLADSATGSRRDAPVAAPSAAPTTRDSEPARTLAAAVSPSARAEQSIEDDDDGEPSGSAMAELRAAAGIGRKGRGRGVTPTRSLHPADAPNASRAALSRPPTVPGDGPIAAAMRARSAEPRDRSTPSPSSDDEHPGGDAGAESAQALRRKGATGTAQPPPTSRQSGNPPEIASPPVTPQPASSVAVAEARASAESNASTGATAPASSVALAEARVEVAAPAGSPASGEFTSSAESSVPVEPIASAASTSGAAGATVNGNGHGNGNRNGHARSAARPFEEAPPPEDYDGPPPAYGGSLDEGPAESSGGPSRRVAPKSGAARRAKPAADETELAPWEAFLNRVRVACGIDMYISLTSCELMSMTPELMEIRPFTAELFKKLSNPSVTRQLREVAQTHVGLAVEVRMVDRPTAAPGAGVTMQGIEDARIARLKAEALEDPLVQRAIRDLGAAVTGISVLED